MKWVSVVLVASALLAAPELNAQQLTPSVSELQTRFTSNSDTVSLSRLIPRAGVGGVVGAAIGGVGGGVILGATCLCSRGVAWGAIGGLIVGEIVGIPKAVDGATRSPAALVAGLVVSAAIPVAFMMTTDFITSGPGEVWLGLAIPVQLVSVPLVMRAIAR